MKPLRIGTRGSALALWQANHIKERLKQLHGVEAELVRIRTSGDHFQTASVAQIGAEMGTKGVFIKELEDALLAGRSGSRRPQHEGRSHRNARRPCVSRVDEAGRPARLPDFARRGTRLRDLPPGARIGTSSLRRQAQLRHHRADLEVLDLRGNVDTRLRKVAAGEFDAIVLAVAGVTRLGALR